MGFIMETLTVFTVAATPSLMLCIHMQTCPHAFQKDACGHAVTHTCSALNWNADRQGFFCDYMCWGVGGERYEFGYLGSVLSSSG